MTIAALTALFPARCAPRGPIPPALCAISLSLGRFVTIRASLAAKFSAESRPFLDRHHGSKFTIQLCNKPELY